MSSVTSAFNPPKNRLRLSQTLLMAARKGAKAVARRLNANVDYDLHLYEAISSLRRWSSRDVVFDVGANDGRTIFRLMRHVPPPRIYAFEPVSSTFRTLADSTQELGNVRPRQVALGSESGERTMYLYDQASLNSFYADWGSVHGRSANDEQPTETVEVTTVDRLIDELGLDRVHLLKVDTEGHDLEVLKGAERTLREGRVDLIQVEAGFWMPGRSQPSIGEIQAYIGEFGYYLYGIYNQCRTPIPASAGGSGGRTPPVLAFCDALFVRARSRSPETGAG